MLDFNRDPQIFPDVFAKIPTPNLIAPYIQARAYWDNQTVEVRMQASRDSQLEWDKYKLHWELNKTRGVEGVGMMNGSASAASIGCARVPMPRVQTAQLIPLSLRLIDTDGYELANHADTLLVLPSHAAHARYNGKMAVITMAGCEAAVVHQLNYAVEESLSTDTRVVVTNSPDAETLRWVQNGGRMLFVCEGEDAVFWQYGHGDSSEGNWITNTSWLRPEVYPNLKIENPLNLPLQRVMPRGSIGGLPQDDPSVQRDFLAGRISGWVQRPTIHTAQFGYGHGMVIMTTYTLLEALCFGDPDPVGVVMLNDLINYLVSDSCKPTLQVKV